MCRAATHTSSLPSRFPSPGRVRHRVRPRSGSVLVLLRGLVLLAALGTAPGCVCSHPMEGQRAPDLRLLDMQGTPHRLGEYFDRDTILAFWMDCLVCRSELPLLDSAARQSGGRLQVVGVSSHHELPEVRAFVERLGLGFPVLLDPDEEAERAYQVVSVPTAFLIEPPGRIVEVRIGTAGYELAWKRRVQQQQAARP